MYFWLTANVLLISNHVIWQVVNFSGVPIAAPATSILATAPVVVAAPAIVPQVATALVSAPNGFYSSPTNPATATTATTTGYYCNNGYCYWIGTGDDDSSNSASGRVFCHRGQCFFTTSGSNSASSSNYGGLKCENGACYDNDKTKFGGSTSSTDADKFCIDSYCFSTTYNQARYGYPWYSGIRWN